MLQIIVNEYMSLVYNLLVSFTLCKIKYLLIYCFYQSYLYHNKFVNFENCTQFIIEYVREIYTNVE